MTNRVFDLDGQHVAVSSPDKVLFPEDGVTKADLAAHYAAIAQTALAHYRDRPVTLHRFPDGIDGDGFFQKNTSDHFPDWIATTRQPKQDGTVDHVLVDRAATLVYLANQGCITPHIAVTRADRPDRPDRLIFDLDPSDGDFGKVQEVAASLRERLDGLDIASFVQVTGSRGLHIVIPLRRTADFDTLRTPMRVFADTLAEALPNLATTAQRKRDRGDRVLIDTFRTAPGQTFVAPYAVRARAGAPVATPLRWTEALSGDMTPQHYRMDTIGKRLAQTEDPWADMDKRRTDARTVASKLTGRS